MTSHPSLVPRKTRPPGIHFPLRNEKTITEDFTKTMGFRDSKWNITQQLLEIKYHITIMS
jgi:hypothetical protein